MVPENASYKHFFCFVNEDFFKKNKTKKKQRNTYTYMLESTFPGEDLVN